MALAAATTGRQHSVIRAVASCKEYRVDREIDQFLSEISLIRGVNAGVGKPAAGLIEVAREPLPDPGKRTEIVHRAACDLGMLHIQHE